MPFHIDCKCGKKLNIPDHLDGTNIKCPSCGALQPARNSKPDYELELIEPPLPSQKSEPQTVPASPVRECKCGTKVRIPDHLSGRAAKCPKCGSSLGDSTEGLLLDEEHVLETNANSDIMPYILGALIPLSAIAAKISNYGFLYVVNWSSFIAFLIYMVYKRFRKKSIAPIQARKTTVRKNGNTGYSQWAWVPMLPLLFLVIWYVGTKEERDRKKHFEKIEAEREKEAEQKKMAEEREAKRIEQDELNAPRKAIEEYLKACAASDTARLGRMSMVRNNPMIKKWEIVNVLPIQEIEYKYEQYMNDYNVIQGVLKRQQELERLKSREEANERLKSLANTMGGMSRDTLDKTTTESLAIFKRRMEISTEASKDRISDFADAMVPKIQNIHHYLLTENMELLPEFVDMDYIVIKLAPFVVDFSQVNSPVAETRRKISLFNCHFYKKGGKVFKGEWMVAEIANP